MSKRNITLERLLLALFVVSGFAGLIYQSIWSHYLGLSLGHAAYAQTLVLGIFMGGMALGAWLVSWLGVRWRRLIFAYAVVEILIGLAGLGFHSLFVYYTAFSQETVYPAIESISTVRAWQWITAAMLIAPQSIMLGMTFPLMSAGYLRIAPKADGEILGGLYFTNSIGAACGALAATFCLLPWVGMPGAMLVAGALNIMVGVGAWIISRRADVAGVAARSTRAASPAPASNASRVGFYRIMLLAAGITGATSFVYEIGWIRLLNQSLGTTVHSFELMLAAFIFGLAFGGWWIRKRSHRISDVVGYAGYAQIWMGLAALISLPVFSQSFRWVGGLMAVLPKTDAGYALFSLSSAGISLLVMFPAAFFAGMTLPLFTMALLRQDAGEASIGRVYATNTLGAIIGVVLATHALIPIMGLRGAVTIAAIIDIVLGFYLIRRFGELLKFRKFASVSAIALIIATASIFFGQLDPRSLASGVFRHGRAELADDVKLNFFRDGKTASVAFYSLGSVGIIATNGKPDASLEMDYSKDPSGDEITMIMAGVLPLASHPAPEQIAIIGWGSGLSTHTVLGSLAPKQVDTIEIEHAMYEGARWYGSRVARAYEDPRSLVHFDDARTFFSTGQRRYDVIISEPSNPWVNGVASLFTQEFYRFMRQHLNEDGLVVQWIQSYELSDALLATMTAALIQEFSYVDVYLANSSDLLFLAGMSPIPPLDYSRLADALPAELQRVGLTGLGDFKIRKVASRQTLEALVALRGATPHSDFYPEVALNAPRARFTGASVRSFMSLMAIGMPVLEMTHGRIPASLSDAVTQDLLNDASKDHWSARHVRSAMLREGMDGLVSSQPGAVESIETLLQLSAGPISNEELPAWLQAIAVAADLSVGYLPAEDHAGVWIDPRWINIDEQPELVQKVLAAFTATAHRSGSEMRFAGLSALESLTPDDPLALREQMLIIAELGAIAQGDFGGVSEIERAAGGGVPAISHYGFARAYLLAWADVVGQGK